MAPRNADTFTLSTPLPRSIFVLIKHPLRGDSNDDRPASELGLARR